MSCIRGEIVSTNEAPSELFVEMLATKQWRLPSGECSYPERSPKTTNICAVHVEGVFLFYYTTIAKYEIVTESMGINK